MRSERDRLSETELGDELTENTEVPVEGTPCVPSPALAIAESLRLITCILTDKPSIQDK